MIIEALIAMPGSGEIFFGGIMNNALWNIPDFVKIGLMAILALVLVKWTMATMGMTNYEQYI